MVEINGFKFPSDISFLCGFTAISIICLVGSIVAGQFAEVANSMLFIWLCIGIGKLILRIFKR